MNLQATTAEPFQKVKNEIIAFLESGGIYSFAEMREIYNANRKEWQLPSSLKINGFLNLLVSETQVKKYDFRLPSLSTTKYVVEPVDIFDLALSLNLSAYLTHCSALYFNGLIPESTCNIYLNIEQTEKPTFSNQLGQENIDKAFASQQRTTNSIANCNGYFIYILSGKYTNKCGVKEFSRPSNNNIRATDLERTLIDIVVRPNYAGGVKTIIEAYTKSKNNISIETIVKYLKILNYKYPYHQAIGFLLDYAGYNKKNVKTLKKFGLKNRFYLCYGMQETLYSKKWKLYYPKELGTRD
jgi:predicted transcriptional regulator of viral defense system